MISIVKREIAIEKELRSKIEWENDLVKYTKKFFLKLACLSSYIICNLSL